MGNATIDPTELLAQNLDQTHFPSLTLDVTLRTSDPGAHVQRVRILQSWRKDSAEFDLMGCIVEGNPLDLRFLIQERLEAARFNEGFTGWVAPSRMEHVRRLVPSPWDPFAGTEIRSMDLAPAIKAMLAVAPAVPIPVPTPANLGTEPPPGCTVVEIGLVQPPTIFMPDRLLVWIDQAPTRRVEYRTESFRQGQLLRVATAAGWQQPGGAGSPWLAMQRAFIDAQGGGETTLAVDSFHTRTIPPEEFTVANLLATSWISS
jgi:hypothetical protein